jgi:hypothetical protein
MKNLVLDTIAVLLVAGALLALALAYFDVLVY